MLCVMTVWAWEPQPPCAPASWLGGRFRKWCFRQLASKKHLKLSQNMQQYVPVAQNQLCTNIACVLWWRGWVFVFQLRGHWFYRRLWECSNWSYNLLALNLGESLQYPTCENHAQVLIMLSIHIIQSSFCNLELKTLQWTWTFILPIVWLLGCCLTSARLSALTV